MTTTFPPPSDDPQRPREAPGARPTAGDALEMLDFGAVRAAVADRVRYGPARDLALALSPSFDPAEVRRLGERAAQARRLLEEVGEIDLALGEVPAGAVGRAALGGVISGPELAAVAESLRVQARAASLSVRAAAAAPALAEMARRIPDLSRLEREIRGAVSARGEVLDGASPRLGAVRAGVRRAYEQVTGALSAMIEAGADGALQDRVISVRSSRLCLQVRSEARRHVPGIVHDASNTGATVYVEPLATVELGNAWRGAALEEEREVAAALARLSAMVGRRAADHALGSEITARIDLALAGARWGAAAGAVTAPPPPGPGGGGTPELRLVDARHPLLGAAAVPISVRLGGSGGGPGWSVLVVTGPNTGGKTVAMKTVGLLVAMNQAGLQVTAGEGTALPVFDSIWVDLGDGQSLERGASTFGSHMLGVTRVLAGAGPRSLALFDELGSSTDPEEGAALARAVLDDLASRGVPTIATTHHRSVAAHAAASAGMENASVELDPVTLEPTYRLVMGAPGRSYAMSVAAGLGVPSRVMRAARSYLDPRSVRYDESVARLERSSEAAEAARALAEGTAASAERARIELEAERAALAMRRAEIAESMHEELSRRHAQLRSRLRRAEAALSWAVPAGTGGGADGAERGALDAAAGELSAARDELAVLEAETLAVPGPAPDQPDLAVEEGAEVEVRGLGVAGTVRSLDPDAGEAEVVMGDVRLRIDRSRLVPTGRQPEPGPAVVATALGPALRSVELDVRGMRAEGAESELDMFLDRALRDGLSSVRIVHGKATGVLRRVVRDRLEGHPLVRSYAAEEPGRGGEGSTRVDLV